MSREPTGELEAPVVTVTLVARGLRGPLVTALALPVVGWAASHYVHLASFPRNVGVLVLEVPTLAVLLGRTWRWRAQQITVTTHRVIRRSGVLRRHEFALAMNEILGTRIEQTLWQRLRRRGGLTLETDQGPVRLGCVRHPASLVRLIDKHRPTGPRNTLPLDTVFTYRTPEPFEAVVEPSSWHRRARSRDE